MKILYIVHTNAVGGSNKALFNILDYMSLRHDVRVVFPKPSDGISVVRDYLQQNGIKYYNPCFYDAFVYGTDKNPVRRLIRTIGRLYRHLKMRRKIKEIIDDFQPDIVHTNNGIIDIALDYCRKKDIPHVWHLREYQDLDFHMSIMPSKKIWMKRIHKQGNYNVAITKGIYNYFHLRECDTFIYDGVLNLSKKVIIDVNKSNYFLFVAGNVFTPGKGLLDALRAFSKFSLSHHDYSLYVVGKSVDNQYKNQCMSLIKEKGLQEKIKFLGVRNDVDELMAKSIATLVPSEFEGFGFITAEAMFNDSLVIGRDSAGTKEQFDNGLKITGEDIGLRFNTISDLEHCLERSITVDLSGMRKRARTVVTKLYGIETSCEKIEKYYITLTHGTKKLSS